jgi:peptidyl-prolyl cis-trans isomerase B (cyclophilin B)
MFYNIISVSEVYMKIKLLLRITVLALMLASVLTFFSGCVTIGERKPIVTIEFSNGKEVKIRLYPDKAPNTVNNFISLINSGYYDNSPVHRIIEYAFIQMGKSAEGDKQNAGYYIEGEFNENGYGKNDMIFEEGTVAMARLTEESEKSKEFFDTASSQFFITLERKTTLDGLYAAFGKVISGMKYVQEISKMDVDANNLPRDEIYIKSITVDTFDYEPKEPKTIPIEDDKK